MDRVHHPVSDIGFVATTIVVLDPEVPGDLERILRDQLGMALEKDRATVEVLVVR